MRHRERVRQHSNVNLPLKLNILLVSLICETYKCFICIEDVILSIYIRLVLIYSGSFRILFISVILRVSRRRKMSSI